MSDRDRLDLERLEWEVDMRRRYWDDMPKGIKGLLPPGEFEDETDRLASVAADLRARITRLSYPRKQGGELPD
jgi:hypothetical protein